jgi:hypothetical protein
LIGTPNNNPQSEGFASWLGDFCTDYQGAESAYMDTFPTASGIYRDMVNQVVEDLKKSGWEMPWEES